GARNGAGRGPRQEYTVRQLARDLQHPGEERGNVDRDLRPQRPEPEIEPLDRDDFATMRDETVLHERAHDRDGVAQSSRRLHEWNAVLGLDRPGGGAAEPQDEPAVGELIYGGRSHADRRRAAHEHARDARAQTD